MEPRDATRFLYARMWVTPTGLAALTPAESERARLLFRAYRAEIGLDGAPGIDPEVDASWQLFRPSA